MHAWYSDKKAFWNGARSDLGRCNYSIQAERGETKGEAKLLLLDDTASIAKLDRYERFREMLLAPVPRIVAFLFKLLEICILWDFRNVCSDEWEVRSAEGAEGFRWVHLVKWESPRQNFPFRKKENKWIMKRYYKSEQVKRGGIFWIIDVIVRFIRRHHSRGKYTEKSIGLSSIEVQ